jgi:hypothetical protein
VFKQVIGQELLEANNEYSLLQAVQAMGLLLAVQVLQPTEQIT